MSAPTRHFIRHYVEMLVAMFVGMVVLGMPALMGLGAAGVTSAELRSDAPALLLLGMGITMTVPMVAWMRFRGHAWRPSMEMAAAMYVPTFAAMGLVGTVDYDLLMGVEHVAMLLAMLGAMLYRRDEYSHAHHRIA
jgi:hypothetical protein